MADEEEIRSELEAVQAVYGEDCRIIQDFPPHIAVHVKPRTADDASLQFVEVVLGLKCDREYPKKPPYVYVLEMKGLDENRQTHLVASINNKARDFSSCLMLVALCEEAIEVLCSMNHPEGNCPLCLYPLSTEDKSDAFSFMKLMSCYHCFHSECIMRFWKWILDQNATQGMNESERCSSDSLESSGMQNNANQRKANCPVCRKLFDATDMEHVLDYLATISSELSYESMDGGEEEKTILQSDLENSKREKYEALLKLQQEKNGLIEPKKNLLIVPGMFLPENVVPPNTSTETNNEQIGEEDANSAPESNSGDAPSEATASNSDANNLAHVTNSVNSLGTSKHSNSESRRKRRVHRSKRPTQAHAPPNRQQWMRREKDYQQP